MPDTDLYGIYRGRVLNIDDPRRLSRVEVAVAAAIGEVSGWAAACEPVAKIAVGDTVWVMFEAGDPNRPVCLGRMPR